jgi:hypothetical protein
MNGLKLLGAAFALALSAQASATGGLVDLGVYDRAQSPRLPVHRHPGRANIAGTPGNEYSLTLRNNSGEPLLAVVSVDGVNVVTGESAEPHASRDRHPVLRQSTQSARPRRIAGAAAVPGFRPRSAGDYTVRAWRPRMNS